MSYQAYYVLSPCGTSLLSNQVTSQERNLVFKHANAKNKEEIPREELAVLEDLIERRSAELKTANYQEAARMSAELNSILALYEQAIPDRKDFHFLLATDTWLGEQTAGLVEQWLKAQSSKLIIHSHRHIDLQTQELISFQLSLSELVRKLSTELPIWSSQGYKIIFNLTGGFKGVQGFLQGIAHFYADEIVYIFERSLELLRIPQLPIKLDAAEIVEAHLQTFRLLSINLPVEPVNEIPETLLLQLEGQISLSPWGELIWKESKGGIYQKCLYEPPIEKIQYSAHFEKEVASLAPKRIQLVNERIDQLSHHLTGPHYNPKSLDFKKLKGNEMSPSTHELDAWSDQDAKRIFGHFEGAVFVIDHLDKALH